MQRREFMAAAGTAAVVMSAAPTFAEAAESLHPAKYQPLVDSTGRCVSTGEACLRHCLGLLAHNDTSMAGCMDASYQMVTTCGALRTLAAVNSPHVPALAKVVAELCADCEKQCEKFPDVAECKACGDSCKTCAEECRKVSA